MTFAGNNHFILSEAASAQQAGKFFKGGEKGPVGLCKIAPGVPTMCKGFTSK